MIQPVRHAEDSAAAPSMKRRLLALVFVPFACGYFLSFLLRNINAVVFPELVSVFALSPGALGFITSAYFLVFASFQLPLGLLLDRYGPRRVNAALLLVGAAGTCVFGLAQGLPTLVAGRALMGLGFAGCLMSSMTAFVLWFPRTRMATLSGTMVAVGACGALCATKPVELALRVVDWRVIFVALAAWAIVAALLIFTIVPEKAGSRTAITLNEQLRGVRKIFTDREFWRIGLLGALVQANGLAMLGLWAGPWLRDVARLPRPEVAHILLISAACFGIGAISFGALSDRLARKGVAPLTTFKVGAAAAGVGLLCLALDGTGRAVFVLPIFTACCAAGTLAFSLLTARFPMEMAGRTVTALNMLTMGAAFAFQWGVGAVLNLWPQTEGHYAIAGYQAGFGLLFAALFVTLLCSQWPKRAR